MKISALFAAAFLLVSCASQPVVLSDFTAQKAKAVVPSGAIPSSQKMEFVQSLGAGINIGNTLDVITDRDGPGTDETGWGNPRISREYIHALASYGYKTVRLPVTWTEHTGPCPDYIIEEKWLSRVQEVVDWCLEEKLNVIVNMHHDGGTSKTSWILSAATDYDYVNTRLAVTWKQVALRFKDYPQSLVFEAMNEVGFDSNWEKRYEILNGLNQTFVDTVRQTGGANSERYLMASGYWTDIERSCDSQFKMPKDIADKIILSVHYYTPSAFCISMDSSSNWYSYTWGTQKDYSELKGKFDLLYDNFISKGIPVVVGEYGCARGKDEQSRLAWLSSVAIVCKNYGCTPVLWDTGHEISRYNPFVMTEVLSIANSLSGISAE